jgi:hypothetical protein
MGCLFYDLTFLMKLTTGLYFKFIHDFNKNRFPIKLIITKFAETFKT